MSTGQGRKSGNDDWAWSDQQLKECDAQLEDEVTVDTKHDIPYAAGYSIDGSIVYIDRSVPHYMEVKAFGKKIDLIKLDIWKTFAFHEMTEKSLEDDPYDLEYQKAHQCALRLERALVEALGADWEDYNTKTIDLVEKIYTRDSFPDVPRDLDLEPYSCEKDWDCLKKMGVEADEIKRLKQDIRDNARTL